MQEFIVSTLEDENDGNFGEGDLSLREAIAQAESDNTITFSSNLSGGTINLALGELTIDKSLTIQGLGAENTIIDADGNSRVFNIDDNSESESKVAINGLTITGGTVSTGPNQETPSGGGIFNSENLEIDNAIVRDNFAELSGGGISSQGTLTVSNSAIYNNSAFRGSGGGIDNTGTATINQSTISSNTDGGVRGGDGGGIGNTGTIAVNNSTVTNNGSSGIANNGGEITLTSTIVAGNSSNNDLENDDVISGGNNLIGGEATLSSLVGSVGGLANTEDSDLVGTAENPIDPQLGELQNNGGSTPTTALLENSPAIDAGSNLNDLATDQRGEGFDRTVGAGTDIGAFEVQDTDNGGGENPTDLVVSTLEDENDGDFSEGDLSLREAISIAESGSAITFNSNLSGGTITLGLGELLIDKSLTINGLGAENIIIDGGGVENNARVLRIDDNSDTESAVAIDGITIAGGSSQVGTPEAQNDSNPGQGGGILNLENLTLDNAIVRDNSAFSTGGGVYSEGTLVVSNSAIYNNSADSVFGSSGGGIANAGTATISQSTIANNNANARGSGGGIFNTGTLSANSATVSGNSSGISNEGEATITSTIVAGNSNNNDLEGDVTSGGNNLIGGDSSSSLDTRGNLVDRQDSDVVGEADVGTTDNSIDPLLGELQDNGGSTPTIALLENSPAIDAGSNPNDLATDQRGEGFDRTVGESTDIGAFEVQETDNGGGENPTDLVVSILEDENDGDFSAGDLSLREAISLANEQEGEDTITFDSNLSGGVIALTQTESAPRGGGEVNQDLNITDSVNIIGLGAKNLTIDGLSGGNGIFKVSGENTNFNLEGLTLTNGDTQRFFLSDSLEAGTIDFDGANLTLKDSVISGSDAVLSGAISNSGNASIIGSTITDSSGSDDSSPGGAINNTGTLEISNSTVSNNLSRAINNTGTLEVSNSTVSNNSQGDIPDFSSNFGSEINTTNGSVANITSSIISGNSQQNGSDLDGLSGEFTSGGNNLIGDGSGGFVDGENGDLVGTADNPIDSLLGELQDNGGNTPTIALLEESPAIDAGSNPNDLATDQRGEGFDRTVGEGTDIGAFEVQADDGGGTGNDVLIVSTSEDENDGDFSAGDLSLREAISLANEQEGEDTITFDSSLSGDAIAFDETLERELSIDDSVSIIGLGQDNLTLDGGFIFTPQAGVDLAIDGLNLTGGKIDSFGNLTLTNSTISQTISFDGSADNPSIISRGTTNISDSSIIDSNGGGSLGVVIESGTANIERSTIANHEGVTGGSGVLIRTDETVNITNSTIANNSNSRGSTGLSVSSSGTVDVTNSTIANNGGGIGNGGILNNGVTTVTSTVVANNSSGILVGDISGEGELISGGNNLIGNGDDAAGFVDGENGDIVGTNGDDPENPNNEGLIDPLLGELQDNGGSTETLALLEGSPAIDAGSNPNNLETDQRGVGFDRTVGESTDIGAFEVQSGIVDPGNIIGTDGDDFLTGTEESDRLEGLAGNDFLVGLGGDDTLIGGKGHDSLLGGDGNDLLDGGEGDDFLRGDGGNDTFVIAPGAGKDFIVGFDRGHDLIGLSSGIHFADLTFSDRDLIFGDETLATFTGFNANHLTESDFVNV